MFYKYTNFSDIKGHCHGNESYNFTNGNVDILTDTWGALRFGTKHPIIKHNTPLKYEGISLSIHLSY